MSSSRAGPVRLDKRESEKGSESGMDGRTLICVDVGNSRTKVAVSCEESEVWQNLQAVASPELLELSLAGPVDWKIVSVNQPRLNALLRWLEKCRPADRWSILSTDDFPLRLNIENPERLGVDRLAAAYGASMLAGQSGEPVIIINVGTAVTIDLVDGQGTFQGGVIYPGPHTCFQSLARATDQLPDLFVSQVPAAGWGKNTADAISCGVWQMQIGAIREIVSRYQRDWSGKGLPWRGDVFLTGGGAVPLEAIFQGEYRVVSDLVLQGVRAAASRRKEN